MGYILLTAGGPDWIRGWWKGETRCVLWSGTCSMDCSSASTIRTCADLWPPVMAMWHVSITALPWLLPGTPSQSLCLANQSHAIGWHSAGVPPRVLQGSCDPVKISQCLMPHQQESKPLYNHKNLRFLWPDATATSVPLQSISGHSCVMTPLPKWYVFFCLFVFLPWSVRLRNYFENQKIPFIINESCLGVGGHFWENVRVKK